MQVMSLPVDRIRPMKGQPRTHFDKDRMDELGKSIDEYDLNQPVRVTPIEGDPKHDYQLIDGERRWRAHREKKIANIAAWVTPVADPYQQFKISVMSNLGRVGHTPLEIAHAVTRMYNEDPGLTGLNKQRKLEKIGNMCARSASWVEQHLDLLTKLHPEVLTKLDPELPKGKRLGLAMANFLVSLEDQALQRHVAHDVVMNGLKLNQARSLARQMAKTKGVRIGRRDRRPSDDHKLLLRTVERLDEDSERILDIDGRTLSEIFGGQDPDHAKRIDAKLAEIIQRLDDLRQNIKRHAPRRKAP
jgi:ParB family chromosome partitioning protein